MTAIIMCSNFGGFRLSPPYLVNLREKAVEECLRELGVAGFRALPS